MTNLEIRKIDFSFDDTVPFQWLPSHPKFGLLLNAISIIAIAFEKFIVASTRRAIPLITDPAAAAEAEAFLRQEAQHAKNHRKHVAALVRKYPGLQETVDAAVASYDHLIAAGAGQTSGRSPPGSGEWRPQVCDEPGYQVSSVGG